MYRDIEAILKFRLNSLNFAVSVVHSFLSFNGISIEGGERTYDFGFNEIAVEGGEPAGKTAYRDIEAYCSRG